MNPNTVKSPDKLWTKPFIIMLIIGFLINMAGNMMNNTIPLYAKSIGGGTAMAGLTTTVMALTALIFRPISGVLLDTKGRKNILIFGMIVVAVASVTYNFAFIIPVLLLVRFIHGLGFSVQSTATSTIFSDLIPISRIGEGMGYSGLAMTASQAVGPALGLYIVQIYGYNVLFISSLVLVIAAAALSSFPSFYQKGPERNRTAPEDMKGKEPAMTSKIFQLSSLFEKKALLPSLVIFFVTLANSSIFTFLAMYALEKGIKDIGLYFTVSAITMLITRPITGKLSDRFNAAVVVIPGMALIIIALIILSYAATLPVFLLVAVIFGFGSSSVQPVMIALAVKLSPPNRRGAANGTYLCALDVAFGVGALIWGVLISFVGYSNAYRLSTLSIVAAFLIFVFLLNPKAQKIREPAAAKTDIFKAEA